MSADPALFWGTRGSIPTPGPSTVRYGGNTPCVELRTGDGLAHHPRRRHRHPRAGPCAPRARRRAPISGDIFLTHAHWDHIQGIPFFAPLFQKGNRFTIWGSRSLQTSIGRVVRDQMSPVVFPVSFEELQARIEFQELAEERRSVHGYEVSAVRGSAPRGGAGLPLLDRKRRWQGARLCIGQRAERRGPVRRRPGLAREARRFRARRERARARHDVHVERVRAPSWAGDTRPTIRRSSSRSTRTWSGLCCSITGRSGATRRSTAASNGAARWWPAGDALWTWSRPPRVCPCRCEV